MKLIQNGIVWTSAFNDDQTSNSPQFHTDVDIFIDGSQIVWVGHKANRPELARDAETIDASGQVVIPGFVNAHTHAAMTLVRGYADDMPLQEWLNEKIWPAEKRLTPEDIYWGTLLAICEMIRGGTTTFADMYFHMEQVARAAEESGIRATLSRGLVDGPGFEERLQDSRAFIEKWHGSAKGRIRCMLGPHSPYATGDRLREVGELARALDVPVHIHLSETRREVEESFTRHGMSPISYAKEQGLFEGRVLGAHCVHLRDDDISLLAQADVRVVHNPTSNMKLGSGRAPVQEMLDAGVLVAIGTDGAASNNNLDMLEEARLAAFLAKLDERPSSLPAAQVLHMATEAGAVALELNDVGRIEPGFQADLALLRTDAPHWQPLHDPCANLIYSASSQDVSTVLVAGEIVMEDGVIKTVDESQVLDEAAKRGLMLS